MLHYNNNFPIYYVNDPFANIHLNVTIQRNINISKFTLQITDSSIPRSLDSESPPHLFTIQSIPHRRSKFPKKKRERERQELKSREIIPRSKLGVSDDPEYIPNFFRLNQAWREKEACNVGLTFLADTTGCFLIDTPERGWGMLATPWYLAAVAGPAVSKRRSPSLCLSLFAARSGDGIEIDS